MTPALAEAMALVAAAADGVGRLWVLDPVGVGERPGAPGQRRGCSPGSLHGERTGAS